jgi:hypothetical protein
MPSPRRYRYRTVDVFTTRQLEGNQLAVFPEATGVLEAPWHHTRNLGTPSHVSRSLSPGPVPRRPLGLASSVGTAARWRVASGAGKVSEAGTGAAGASGEPALSRRGRRRRGGGITGGSDGRDRLPSSDSAARPSAAKSWRTAWGSVTAPRICRGPPQHAQTGTASSRMGWPRCHSVAIAMGARGLSRALKGLRRTFGHERRLLRSEPRPTLFSRVYGDPAQRARAGLRSALSRLKHGLDPLEPPRDFL